MDNTKRKKGKPKKKNSFLKFILSCTSGNEEDDTAIETTTSKSRSKTDVNKAQIQIIPATTKKSSSCMTDPSLFEPISQKSDKLPPNKNEEINDNKQRLEPITQRSPFTATNTVNSENKNLTDQLVRTILSKYLVMKNSDNSNSLEKPVLNEKVEETAKPEDVIQIEYFEKHENAVDSKVKDVKTGAEPERNNDDKPKPNKGDFPAKTKSAPTNSAAHDSLADICTKYSHFNQQEHYSDSYDSCPEENCVPRNKLELIFDKSSEELAAEDVALEYTISCENTPVYAGIQRQDSLLHTYEKRVRRRSTITSQELRIEPSAMGEFNSYTDSTTSLKWKLIISHHKDLK